MASHAPVDIHGRPLTTTPDAADHYRRAQAAARDDPRVVAALEAALAADPVFAVAIADHAAFCGDCPDETGRRLLAAAGARRRLSLWERQHVEVVMAAVSGRGRRAADLLPEHVATAGPDPLAEAAVDSFQAA